MSFTDDRLLQPVYLEIEAIKDRVRLIEQNLYPSMEIRDWIPDDLFEGPSRTVDCHPPSAKLPVDEQPRGICAGRPQEVASDATDVLSAAFSNTRLAPGVRVVCRLSYPHDIRVGRVLAHEGDGRIRVQTDGAGTWVGSLDDVMELPSRWEEKK